MAAAAGAMPSATFMARNPRMTRMPRPPTPMRGCSERGAGKEAKLCHMGHLTTENRNGLMVDARLTEADGTAERTTALDMTLRNEATYRTVSRRILAASSHSSGGEKRHSKTQPCAWQAIRTSQSAIGPQRKLSAMKRHASTSQRDVARRDCRNESRSEAWL